ncbi:MAG: hypothetical protein ACI9W4_000743 [Rhodothermales bacterium]
MIHNVALGSEIDEVKLRIPRGQWGRSTVEQNNPLLNLRGLVDEVTVPRRTLDSFGLADVSFIKIDVEGHEHCVLVGALETIRRERPIVFVEAEERHRPGTVAAVLGSGADQSCGVCRGISRLSEHRVFRGRSGPAQSWIRPTPKGRAFLAGRQFQRYRLDNRGPKTSLLPDFLIGAHAAVLDIPLVTRDVRRYRTYFPRLTLITPEVV